jgi:hypothetical protein
LYLSFEERSGSVAWRSTVTDGSISGIEAESPVGLFQHINKMFLIVKVLTIGLLNSF